MLENARRQLILTLLVALAAILCTTLIEVRLGLDLSGGTQLIYEVDIDKAKRDGMIPVAASQQDIDRIMEETVAIISDRVDPQGTVEAVVTRRGPTGVLVELPAMAEADAEAVEARIRDLGRLEMRIVASDAYTKGDVRFQLSEEQQRLRAWLDKDDGANRKLLMKHPERVRDFNLLPTDDGGSLSPHLRWYPQIIGPSLDNPEFWDRVPTKEFSDQTKSVAVFTDVEYNEGRVPPGVTQLVELMPVNTHERFFRGEDLDPSAIRRGLDDAGRPCILYRMKPERQDAYADWSEEYIKQPSAIILNNVVHSAPTFQGRILGNAQITGQFTDREVDELVKVLRTGSLKVQPNRQAREVIGPSLGRHSIELGMISIGVGAVIVIAFILFYYRLAGIVAFLALALNVLLIFALVKVLRATLTLPGLAGLVLTMGMAIDANILIYERIREELLRGKQLLQACRAGFDRAMITIVDSNLTTFIAGLVLYQLGVGPIRGFAVTMMIGILTTLFTAFFASRVIFHYLVESPKVNRFRFRHWLENVSFDFLAWTRPALVLSTIVCVGGLAAFLVFVPTDRSLHLDFKGGANLKVVLAEPTTAQEIRQLLLGDSEFSRLFPGPAVSTLEAGRDGRSRRFSIKVKLTDELRSEIEAAQRENPDHPPPYQTGITRILGSRLVARPFSNASVFDEPGSATQFAEIELHFQEPIDVSAFQAKLEAGRFVRPTVRSLPDPGAATAKDVKVEYLVDKEMTADRLFEDIRVAAESIVGTSGAPVSLSDPIPESSEIGGRMVGELRNAAIGSLLVAMFLIVMYIRVRFHEYKYGIAAVVALIHDVLVTLGCVVVGNYVGIVDAEIGLAMIAAFLTIIGYSINDTIVIFDRVREMLAEQTRLGERIDHKQILNTSMNKTLSRTILTSATTFAVVLAQFVVNRGSGTELEAFSFAMIAGLISGTYSTVFIASPIMLWLWRRESQTPGASPDKATKDAPVPATSGA